MEQLIWRAFLNVHMLYSSPAFCWCRGQLNYSTLMFGPLICFLLICRHVAATSTPHTPEPVDVGAAPCTPHTAKPASNGSDQFPCHHTPPDQPASPLFTPHRASDRALLLFFLPTVRDSSRRVFLIRGQLYMKLSNTTYRWWVCSNISCPSNIGFSKCSKLQYILNIGTTNYF